MARDGGTAELERLFARGMLSRRQFVGGLAALGVTASGIDLLLGSEPLPAEAQSATARYLVLIVLDAFRADYLSLETMPALSALTASGISYDRAWVGQLESYTPVSHATISTGSMPRSDGLIGFEWLDPVTGQERLDGWPKGTLAGQLEHDLRESGVPSIPLAVKAANPRARVVALSSEKVYAANAMGGWAADYILYHSRNKQGYLVPAALPKHMPPAEFFSHPGMKLHLPIHHFTDWDYLSTVLALAAVQEFRPEVLMVNMPGADVYGHIFGGPATPGVMTQVIAGLDRNIARIVRAYKDAGLYDQTLFVVTSDHGMVPNDRAVPGATTKATVRSAGGQYDFHTGGTAADIYLKAASPAPAVAAAMASVPGVAAAYYQVPGTYQYELAAGVKPPPGLDAAYRYLLGTFSCPQAPTVVAHFRENTIGSAFSNAHGDHGGANWGAQAVPLIFSGPGVPRNTVSHHPARLMDVAPTVLRLLGLPTVTMDGAVLADALVTPAPSEIALQAQIGTNLTAYQDALMAQSTDNIAEDQKTGHQPPPSKPPKP